MSSLCQTYPETIDHLFFDCPFPNKLWDWWYVNLQISFEFRTHWFLNDWLKEGNTIGKEKIAQTAIASQLWFIWKMQK